MHKPTMTYGQRPFGIGLLLGACDDSGPHLYQLCPSANYFDCIAMAIGARCQLSKISLPVKQTPGSESRDPDVEIDSIV
ncbi:hypothetical protein MXB_2751 [Myxobolus squamalis]|nr:hypothetical protein MXB_2751 [Myxobolus squamalis]